MSRVGKQTVIIPAGTEAKLSGITFSVKGPKIVTAGDISTTGQVEVLNKDLYICEITGKNKYHPG